MFMLLWLPSLRPSARPGLYYYRANFSYIIVAELENTTSNLIAGQPAVTILTHHSPSHVLLSFVSSLTMLFRRKVCTLEIRYIP